MKANIRFLFAVLLAATISALVLSASAQKANPARKPMAAASASSVFISASDYRSAGDLHKVSVTDRQLVQNLKAQGARVIADYGSSVLVEVQGAAALSAAASHGAQIMDDSNLLLLNAATIDTKGKAPQAPAASDNGGKQLYLVQFAGPIRPDWYQALVNTGVRIVTYIPNNAYLVYGAAGNLNSVHAMAAGNSSVQWTSPYLAQYRLDPFITRVANAKGGKPVNLPNLSSKGNELFTIQMVEDAAANKATLALIGNAKLEPIVQQDSMLGYVNVKVALPRAVVIQQIAQRSDVVSIQPWVVPQKRDERQDIIMTGNISGSPAVPTPMNYLNYLTGRGFDLTTTASFAVNLSDSGIDNATTTPNHFALYRVGDPTTPANSRVIYNRLQGSPNSGSTLQGCDGHGNENSHIIGGYVPTGTVNGVNFAAFPHADGSGFRWDVGLAPFVKVGSSVIFDPNTFTSPIYQNLESQAYRDSARISSNSWGSSSNSYTTDSQQYDALVRDAQPDTGCSGPNCISTAGNQEYVIVFAAGNGGSGANTIGEPSTAKNVITVGAAENVNPFGGADGCGIGDTGADNANDIISFSSRGPTSDGRKKPDIVAPGTHVSAGVAQASIVSPTGSGNGAQLACFNGGGVCGGVGSNFFPAGQQWYTASSGTSHSTPAVAGVAALIRQHFINQGMTPPSPAMTKALLLNSARYMNGVGANDTLPSNSQGMGEVNLNSYFDIFSSSHIFHDEVVADTFTASGQQRSFGGTVSDTGKPYRVTLVWTDPPGPTSGSAFVNNLDLEVTVGGNTYKGNVFSGAFSATGGTADTRNNVESVIIPAGVSGGFSVKVTGTNIAGDGVPNNGQPLDQDFALVVYNGQLAPIAIGGSGASIVSAGPNGLLDPGETVTVSIGLQNFGSGGCTTALTGVLQPTGGVTNPSGPANYGAVCAPGSPVSRNFTFTVDPNLSCGNTVTLSMDIFDGATNYGTVTYTFPTGSPLVGFAENFDGVVAPALPSGWVATNAQGAAPAWVTSATTPDTAPNDAFIDDPAALSDKRLDTPGIVISSAAAQVSFRNNYNLEGSGSNYYDGAVLEVSSPNINAGAYTDITDPAVGGSFASGGYNGTISSGFSNPIGGRMGWGQNSGGYINTVANLGPNVNGQTIKLRFRMCSDSSVAATGWRVDTISITNGTFCAPIPTAAVSRKSHGGTPYDIALPLVPVGTLPGIEDRIGQGSGGDHQMIVTFANPVTVGSATVTSGTGSVASYSVSGATVTMNLTGVANAQTIRVTMANVVSGSNMGDVSIPMGVLRGDTNGDGTVGAPDISQTKAQSGHGASPSNFREDVVPDGSINNIDVSAVKAVSGTSLP